MPCARSARGCIALAILAVAAGLPAPAFAAVSDVFESLDESRLRPAPLVPTRVPAALRPIDRTIETLSSPRRGGYGVRLAREGGPTTAAVVAIQGGGYASMRAARADLLRRQGYRGRPTRIRGRAGLALTRRSPRGHGLVWRENRTIYWIGTGTPRTVSPAELRATANGLDRLEGSWVGSGPDPQREFGAVLVTTRRTVTGSVSWSANCTNPDGSEGTGRAGSTDLTLEPRSGDRFTVDLAGRDTGSLRWAGQLSGSVTAEGISVTVRATGTFDGQSCDTGPVTMILRRMRG